ncbi:MAG: divergent polysaccharide deacetylase family protein, partial [Acidiferrobacterales bacterium]
KLVSGMPDLEITLTLKNNLTTVPYAIGVNNHMGSLLTQQSREIAAVMATLQKIGNLFFVDSLTTPKSIATDMATLFKIPYVRRDIFLDSDRNSTFINNQFDKLLKIAKKRGVGLAIGHPYNETLIMLENRLPSLAAQGIELIPVSELLNKKYRGKEL